MKSFLVERPWKCGTLMSDLLPVSFFKVLQSQVTIVFADLCSHPYGWWWSRPACAWSGQPRPWSDRPRWCRSENQSSTVITRSEELQRIVWAPENFMYSRDLYELQRITWAPENYMNSKELYELQRINSGWQGKKCDKIYLPIVIKA